MEHHSTDRQDSGIFINRQSARQALIYGVCLLVALVAIGYFNNAHPSPPQRDFYYPDPTPIVIETQRIEILSGNKFFSDNQTCIGVCR